ncbi:MAG: alpha/beta hydrolase [Alphaproteobacteria bacterium]|nr:alpha/beta hydrolase [Alphaproteobacteria bacterium]
MNTAPLYNDSAQGPKDGIARWAEADDGVRLRMVFWGMDAANGTVLIFPGRTEFAEKYGRTAQAFQDRGFATATIDWRGQGLSDRLAPNRKLGHVDQFTDYQNDVEALMQAMQAQGLPEPYYLCAHSMGGTIGLRSLQNGLAVKRTVFSAPMWGLTIDPLWRPLVQAVAKGGQAVGLGAEFAPGTGPLNYLQSHDYTDNVLTSSKESWGYLTGLVGASPGLEIGGPSVQWLHAALTETKELAAMTPPDHEVFGLIGSDETVVNRRDVIDYFARWPGAQINIFTGARHEILMESTAIRKRAHDMIDAFYCS